MKEDGKRKNFKNNTRWELGRSEMDHKLHQDIETDQSRDKVHFGSLKNSRKKVEKKNWFCIRCDALPMAICNSMSLLLGSSCCFWTYIYACQRVPRIAVFHTDKQAAETAKDSFVFRPLQGIVSLGFFVHSQANIVSHC